MLVGGLRAPARDVTLPHWPSMPLAPPLLHPPPMVALGCPEEGECFLAEKQLKKTKRIRTRVDAGEPRNPYSGAPTFVSVGGLSSECVSEASSDITASYPCYPYPHQTWWRPPNHIYNSTLQTPMTYCATVGAAVQPLPLVHYIGQNQANFPECLVSARQRQGAATAAMLSELFAGHNNKNTPTTTLDQMGILDKLASGGADPTALLRGPAPDNVLLREILQGRKRDILTLEEIEAARALHQNINNNNSPVYKSGPTTVELTNADSSADEATREINTSHDSAVEDDDIQCDSGDAADVTDVADSNGSPDSSGADCGSGSATSGGESKKSRLESIVSVMRSSPPPPHSANATINGCKKRKLYLPQQHDSRQQNDVSTGSSTPSVSGSPVSPPASPQPPGSKSRKLDSHDLLDRQKVEEEEATDLQIDLSLRSEARLGVSSSPDLPRASSPKVSSADDVTEASSNYLLDYAKHLLNSRTQQSLHQQRNVSVVQDLHTSSHQDLTHKLSLLRSLGGEVGGGNTNSLANNNNELESLGDLLKTEITASVAVIIDSIVNKFVQQRKLLNKQNENTIPELPFSAAEFSSNRNLKTNIGKPNGLHPPTSLPQIRPAVSENNLASLNLPPHLRPQLYKPPAHLFPTSLPSVSIGQTSPHSIQEPEQDEALSLVVTPKKKRHKVTDSRLTPRTVGRLLEDLPRYPQMTPTSANSSPRYNSPPSPPPQPPLPPHSLTHTLQHTLQHPHIHHSRPNPFHQPPPALLPVSLPTSVAIPNPSLHDTGLLYSGVYYNRGPPSPPDHRSEESQVNPHLPPHPPHPLLHPAFLAASSPDSFSHFLKGGDDRTSDCSPADASPFEQHPLSFYADREYRKYSINFNHYNFK